MEEASEGRPLRARLKVISKEGNEALQDEANDYLQVLLVLPYQGDAVAHKLSKDRDPFIGAEKLAVADTGWVQEDGDLFEAPVLDEELDDTQADGQRAEWLSPSGKRIIKEN